MRVMRPAPRAPPSALTRKLSESPTPCRYLAICWTVPSAAVRTRSRSFSSRKVSIVATPSRFTNSLNTLVTSAVLSSSSASHGPFQVPSAQNMTFLLIAPSAETFTVDPRATRCPGNATPESLSSIPPTGAIALCLEKTDEALVDVVGHLLRDVVAARHRIGVDEVGGVCLPHLQFAVAPLVDQRRACYIEI